MLVPSDTAKMLAARRSLIAILANPGSAQNARDGIVLFDKVYNSPSPQEELVIARAAYTGGLSSRAASSYAKAFAGGQGTSRDHFSAGLMLARLNKDNDAIRAFDAVTAPSDLAAAGRYQRARALLALGRRDAARSALRDITTKLPQDTTSASALLLLADLAALVILLRVLEPHLAVVEDTADRRALVRSHLDEVEAGFPGLLHRLRGGHHA